MFLTLYIAAALHLLGALVFGHFEEKTSLARKISKVVFMQGTAALLFLVVGYWNLVFIIGMLAIGLTFHMWWTRKNGIHPLTAEPRERYYQLRGWA
jgi:hypothetical protein